MAASVRTLVTIVSLIAISSPMLAAWRVERTKDAITDARLQEAVCRNEAGSELRVARTADGAVKARYSVSVQTGQLSRLPAILRVDSFPHHEIEPEIAFESWILIPLYLEGPHVIDGPAREMMDGRRLVIRTIREGGLVRDDRFDLAGASAAISEATGAPQQVIEAMREPVLTLRLLLLESEMAILRCRRMGRDAAAFCELAIAKCRDDFGEDAANLIRCIAGVGM